jgi:hypothetical protein
MAKIGAAAALLSVLSHPNAKQNVQQLIKKIASKEDVSVVRTHVLDDITRGTALTSKQQNKIRSLNDDDLGVFLQYACALQTMTTTLPKVVRDIHANSSRNAYLAGTRLEIASIHQKLIDCQSGLAPIQELDFTDISRPKIRTSMRAIASRTQDVLSSCPETVTVRLMVLTSPLVPCTQGDLKAYDKECAELKEAVVNFEGKLDEAAKDIAAHTAGIKPLRKGQWMQAIFHSRESETKHIS